MHKILLDKKLLLFLLILIIAAALIFTLFNKNSISSPSSNTSNELKVHFINVEHGDSILIQQGSKSMLIDAGLKEKGSQIADYLKSNKIQKLDYVVGTHIDKDHIGGMSSIIDSFGIDNILFPNVDKNNDSLKKFKKAADKKNLELKAPTVGDRFKLGDAICTVLAPNFSYYTNDNDYSIVLKITYGKNSFLFTGDALNTSEDEMLNKKLDLKADVLKVAHHGRDDSTSEDFIKAVSPKYAVISLSKEDSTNPGFNNIIDRLTKDNTSIYRTDTDGTIIAVSNGSTITFSKIQNK